MSTDNMPLDHVDAKPRRRIIFDPTINLGHVLTFIGFMAAGMTAYATLEKRQTVQELRSDMDRQAVVELRSDVRELRRTVEEMNRNLARLSKDQQR